MYKAMCLVSKYFQTSKFQEDCNEDYCVLCYEQRMIHNHLFSLAGQILYILSFTSTSPADRILSVIVLWLNNGVIHSMKGNCGPK